jgi:hypothetical protein
MSEAQSAILPSTGDEPTPSDDDEAAAEEEEEEEEVEVSACQCVFDDRRFGSPEECLAHMSAAHGFFLPDAEYVCDLEGLLEHLSAQVRLGHSCLYCPRRFASARAAQHHMRERSHCKLAYEDGADADALADFFDFSSTYEDLSEGDEGDDEAHISPVTGELVLPDGRTLGHRAFARYYRQRYAAPDSRPSVVAQRRERLLQLGVRLEEGGPATAEVVARLTDVQVQAALVLHFKAARRAQVAEQRGQVRRLAADQQREYKSKVDKARSSATTTAKIRDYHKSVL